MRYVLIPGAGGSAWYWSRVVPLLKSAGADAVAVELPADDDSADLFAYAELVRAAAADATAPVVMVAQSMGAFTAPLAAGLVPTARIVLVNPMVPRPGESAGQWWAATGQKQAMLANFRRIGLGDKEFDSVEDFFHDVPADIREEAFSKPEPPQSDTPFEQPWPLDAWPDVPTRYLVCRHDRFFPATFARAMARERLGIEPDEIDGSHCVYLSRPGELAGRLEAYAAQRALSSG